MKKLFILGFMALLIFASVAPAFAAPTERANISAESRRPPWEVPDPDPEPDPDPVPDPELVCDGIVNKYALIIGISDYKAISDLSFCDEDATDWFNYLSPLGYDIILLGDATSSYPQWDGTASEYNIKQAVASILAVADGDDIFVYASSGHGADTRTGPRQYAQLLCCWDQSAPENGESGYILDTEFAAMWAPALTNVFIFLDHCYAGGMNELFANDNAFCFYMVTTCTDDGYGWDVPTFENGMWTYYYLERNLDGQNFDNLHDCFVVAHAEAVADGYDGGDEPQEFGFADFTL